jgi:hypothetical protein
MSEVAGSDKAIGAGFVLVAVTLLGAAVMYGHPTQLGRAIGYAAAITAAVLTIAAIQVLP